MKSCWRCMQSQHWERLRQEDGLFDTKLSFLGRFRLTWNYKIKQIYKKASLLSSPFILQPWGTSMALCSPVLPLALWFCLSFLNCQGLPHRSLFLQLDRLSSCSSRIAILPSVNHCSSVFYTVSFLTPFPGYFWSSAVFLSIGTNQS